MGFFLSNMHQKNPFFFTDMSEVQHDAGVGLFAAPLTDLHVTTHTVCYAWPG